MAKKRRTRAQKERALARRKEQVVYSISKTQTDDKFVIQNSSAVVEKSTKKTIKTDVKTSKKWDPLQKRALRLSLSLLTILLLVQLALWAVFTYTNVDTKLYDLIKL